METNSTFISVFRRYAFTAAGKSDPIAEAEKAAGESVGPATEPMTPEQFNRRLRRVAPARGDRFLGDLHDTCMVIERSKNANLVLYTANLVDPSDPTRAVASGKGCRAVINERDPLRTYWLKLEPEHVARRRARGETGDICDLNFLERKLAYGCQATRAPAQKLVARLASALKSTEHPLTDAEAAIVAEWDVYFSPCIASYVAAPHWPVLMLTLPPLTEGPGRAAGGEGQASSRKDVGGDVATAPGFALEDTVTVMLLVINGELSLLKKVYVTSVEPKHFYQLPSVVSVEAFGVSLVTGKDTHEKHMH